MNEYFQVKNHLANIRNEACDKFDEFLTIKFADDSGPSKFGKPYIEFVYKDVYNRVCDQYEADCQMFFKCCRVNTDFYNPIKSMDLKKIEDLRDYKRALVLNKYEKEYGTKEDDKMNKYIFQKWLSENEI